MERKTRSAKTLNTKTLALKTLAAATLLLTGLGLTGLGLAAPAHADPCDGPQAGTTSVAHGTDDVYHVRYDGGAQGDVAVAPDDPAAAAFLEIKVYDPHGALVTRARGDAGDPLHCVFDVDSAWEWRQYTIKVVNLSNVDIGYAVHFF